MYLNHRGASLDSVSDTHKVSFSGHESFPLRHAWLNKGVVNCSQDNEVFTRDEAMATLGVGKNMVRAIRYWCIAAKMLDEAINEKHNRLKCLQPSMLGSSIFLDETAWDPYLEDIGTLWLIHYLLATNPEKSTTWYLAFNHVHYADFSKESLESLIIDYLTKIQQPIPSRNTLKRDIDVFIRTYIPGKTSGKMMIEDTYDCPLIELELIRASFEPGVYTFNRGSQDTLPDNIFAYALSGFLSIQSTDKKTLSFDEMAYSPFSPGKIFKLNESSLSERLERIEDLTQGSWIYGETAGLKQLYINRDISPSTLLIDYYNQHSMAS